MSGYPYTSQVEDAPTRKALISAFDRLTKAQSDLTALVARVDTLETPPPAAPAGTTTITTISSGGGAGPTFGTYGPGNLIAVDSANTIVGIPDTIAGNVLRSGGVAALPVWGKVQLATDVIGVLDPTNGGTGLSSYTTGDLIYASSSIVLAKLGDVAVGSYLRSGGVSAIPGWSAVTLPNAATTGDLLYGSASNVYSNLADVATGNALISGGVGAAPSWGKIGLTTHVSGILPVANGGTGASSLTNGRVPFVSGGGLTDDADLTFVTDTLTATKVVAPTSLSTPSIITASGALTITPAAGSNLNIALSTTGDFAVNTTQLYVDTSAGNVGIGTSSPTLGKLQVVQSVNGFDTALGVLSSGSAHGTFIWSDATKSYVYSGDGSGVLVLNTVGNVGIGTASPAQLLTVDGITRFRQPGSTRYRSDWAMSAGAMNVNVFDDTGAVYLPILFQVDAFSLVTSTGAQGLYQTATGKVGIGTVTVPSMLTVNGPVNLKNYTVATLPAGTRGDIAYVTDALAPAFLAVLAGGGAVVTPCFYNGTNWVGF